jgi:hypothetical protein
VRARTVELDAYFERIMAPDPEDPDYLNQGVSCGDGAVDPHRTVNSYGVAEESPDVEFGLSPDWHSLETIVMHFDRKRKSVWKFNLSFAIFNGK